MHESQRENEAEREKKKMREAWRLISGGTPRTSICLAGAQKSLVFHPAVPGGMLFQAAWASMKNSFMWKRGDGGNRRKSGNMGRKEIKSERKGEKRGITESRERRGSERRDKKIWFKLTIMSKPTHECLVIKKVKITEKKGQIKAPCCHLFLYHLTLQKPTNSKPIYFTEMRIPKIYSCKTRWTSPPPLHLT